MTENPLILHQYDISPFSQKAQKMMGLKGLSWISVETPLIAPKPDVEALTGGYRGTPVLQVGADVFVDNWMIARALDQVAPDAPRINARGPLSDGALYAWGERLFAPLLHQAFATYKNEWEADFLADRKRVFPDVDFDALDVGDVDRRSQVCAYLGAVEGELALKGAFLGGKQADSWDIHVWGMIWMIRNALPALVPLVEAFPRVTAWYEQMLGLGTGARTDATIEEAWETLKLSKQLPLPMTPEDEPLSDWVGLWVNVSAGSADRGGASGRIIAVDHEQVVLAVEPLPGLTAQVWFPRFGYHVARIDSQ
ncbi:MAG: glutathione S-transferase N-terminal domain-containing protein [Halieaceae bacterium]